MAVKRVPLILLTLMLLMSFLLVPVVSPQADVTTTDDSAVLNDSVFNEIYERVSPSVVAINVIKQQSSQTMAQAEIVSGSGSGFVLDTEGHIMTNHHVVDGATRIEINFRDGTLARARVVGLDPDADLAVLKVDVDADRLSPVVFGDSDELIVGETVLAIGSPFGQRWTLTSGIVSAVERTIQGLTDFSIGGVIQTDAPINPGNSGGPLLNMQGQVIGVNSQIISSTRSNSGVGFAVPSNLAQKVADALITNGFMQYSYLGIVGSDVSLSLIEALELPVDTRGVVVAEVNPGSPADRAGVESAGRYEEFDGFQIPSKVDIITGIEGVPVSGMGELISYLARETQPGDAVTLTVLRDGVETVEVTVNLTPRP